MNNLVTIQYHGILGKQLGIKPLRLAINSVGEAIRATEILTKRSLFKNLYENDKRGIKYRVLINGRDFLCDEPVTIDKPESVQNSELAMVNIPNLRTIDVVPVIEGAHGLANFITIVAGVALIAIGAFGGGPLAPFLITAGLGLVAAGVINLLTSPPKFSDFREIDGSTGRTSYLFNGPENVTREGGPVPIGYGRLLVGSQVISASYVVSDINATQVVTAGFVDNEFSTNREDIPPYIFWSYSSDGFVYVCPRNTKYLVKLNLDGSRNENKNGAGNGVVSSVIAPTTFGHPPTFTTDFLDALEKTNSIVFDINSPRRRCYLFGNFRLQLNTKSGSPKKFFSRILCFGTINGNPPREDDLITDFYHDSDNYINGEILTAAILPPNGMVLIGGSFTEINGVSRKKFAGLSMDGTNQQTGFNVNNNINDNVKCIKVYLDRDEKYKILICGDFTAPTNGIAQFIYSPNDGSIILDSSFNPSTGITWLKSKFRTVEILKADDGSNFIVVGGNIKYSYLDNGVTVVKYGIIALNNTDGSRYGGFSPIFDSEATVSALAVQRNVKLFVGGDFTSVNNNATVKYLCKLNNNGTLSESYDNSDGPAKAITKLAVSEGDSDFILSGGVKEEESLQKRSA